jgi:hypothetical protein
MWIARHNSKRLLSLALALLSPHQGWRASPRDSLIHVAANRQRMDEGSLPT